MNSPLAESQRAALIEAMLPEVPFDGWSRAALRAAARLCGITAEEARALFPGGAADLVAAFSRWADQRMLDRFEALPLTDTRISDRIARAIAPTSTRGRPGSFLTSSIADWVRLPTIL